jgi:hypothetical protein
MSASLAMLPGFRPYVYGAVSGTPSRGRPERVLAAITAGTRPETVMQRFERELGAPPRPRGGFAATRPCGTDAAVRRHYRRGEKLCPACQRANTDKTAAYKARSCDGCGYRLTSANHRALCGSR